jgi:transposase
MSYVDQQSGEMIECPILICAMPYSHFIYARALHSARQEEFLSGLSRAMTYLGAVPQSIKVDNMRVAVKQSNRYEPSFTEAMEHFADHYRTTVLAARVRKPKDKPSVEKAVDLAYKYIYAPLRDRIFTSLDALNAAIHDQVNKLNDRPLTHRQVSRRQLYESQEVGKMTALPHEPYQIKHVTEGKVQRNYHVFLGEDKSQYSVPCALIGKKLRVIYNMDTVEIYDGLARVAVHARNLRKNSYTTLSEHMPQRHREHKQYLGWDADTFRQQAQVIGSGTLHVIDRILASKHFQEQTFNRCLGVLRLAKRYGSDRLEKACRYLGHLPQINYGMVSNVLKNRIDLLDKVEPVFRPPVHDQIRGPQHYC